MDLADLHIFRSVVQAGGVTRAAEKLNRVQSNVTTRVRQLETDLGVELFIRDGKRLHLSPAGKLLLDYADRLLDLAQEAREAVHDAKPRGLLRLGTDARAPPRCACPPPMNEFLRRYPDVTLELRTGNTKTLATAVLAGELDARCARRADRRRAVRQGADLRRGTGDRRRRQSSPDPLAARCQAANRARLRIRLPLPPAAGGLVRAPRGNAGHASSRCPPTTPCSAAPSPAWASRCCRASC